MKVGIISDASRHLNGKTLAGIVFLNSPLFRYSLKFCECEYDQVYILSAKYGLVSPKDTIETYDMDINAMRKKDFVAWLDNTAKQIRERFPTGTELYFHTGRRYRQLVPLLEANYPCFEPMKGLALGQKLQKYKALLG